MEFQVIIIFKLNIISKKFTNISLKIHSLDSNTVTPVNFLTSKSLSKLTTTEHIYKLFTYTKNYL